MTRHPGAPGWWQPARKGWWTGVLFATGSACFAVASLASQWASAPRPAIGVAFFAGSLALVGVCHRWACWRRRSREWRIAALNMLGSVAFGVAAVTSLIVPSTSEPVSAAIANAGTTSGALCFLAGALMLMAGAAPAATRAEAIRRLAPPPPPRPRARS